jgi:hypothetical protein
MTNRLKKITPFVEFPSKEIDEFEILETYFVDVKVKGEWKERYEVEAESEDDARDRWHDGDWIEASDHLGNEREVIEVEKG